MRFSKPDIPDQITDVEGLLIWSVLCLESRVGNDTDYDPYAVNDAGSIFPVHHSIGKLQTGTRAGDPVYRFGGFIPLRGDIVVGAEKLYTEGNVVPFAPFDTVPAPLLGSGSGSGSGSTGSGSYTVDASLYGLELHWSGSDLTIGSDNFVTGIPSLSQGGRNLADTSQALLAVQASGAGFPGLCPYPGGGSSLDFSPTTSPITSFTVVLCGSLSPATNWGLLRDDSSYSEVVVRDGCPVLELYLGGDLAVSVGETDPQPGMHVYIWSVATNEIRHWIDGVQVAAIAPSPYQASAWSTAFHSSDGSTAVLTDLLTWTRALSPSEIQTIGSAIAAAHGITWLST